MKTEIAWQASATREFDRLPERVRESIFAGLARLALAERGDVTRLTDVPGAYRLRIGEYRVVFTLEGSTLVVERVTTRGAAYKK